MGREKNGTNVIIHYPSVMIAYSTAVLLKLNPKVNKFISILEKEKDCAYIELQSFDLNKIKVPGSPGFPGN